MSATGLVVFTVVALFVVRWVFEMWLDQLNRRYVLAHSRELPTAFKEIVDEPTYAKSVQYTLTQNRFGQFETTYDSIVLLVLLLSGVLPLGYRVFSSWLGESRWAMGAFIFAAGICLSVVRLPLVWYDQFRLEARFEFNTTTQKTWWMDRIKGLVLSFALGYPLLVLVLWLADRGGAVWWLWGWAAMMSFQFLMMVLAPVVILPLFNKFTPLPDGSLRERLLALAQRTSFRTRAIQVMDGSKRSRHSNAFFIGFGRFRKIVLFDTLIQQLAEPELEAVLAHEIGHYCKRHLQRMLAASAAGSLAGFFILAVMAKQEWFYRAFGFEPGHLGIAFLLFGLLSGVATFWLAPVTNWWSRRYEYQADAFAKEVIGHAQPLIGALRKLHEKNLSNLTPHPLYSAIHYSHPTLLERERALAG